MTEFDNTKSINILQMDSNNFDTVPPSSSGQPNKPASSPSPKYDTLGPYRILRRIGMGGMGEVYLAEDPGLSRKVAIKTLRSDLVTSDDNIERFMREARAAARLNHPGIVSIFYVGEDQGVTFFAMEYVSDTSLKDLLEQKGSVRVEDAIEYVLQSATALNFALAQNLIHRDVKPGNLLLASGNQIKVADFGLAKDLNLDSSLTTTGAMLGSPLYMSPEQISGKVADHRSDIYSLGATLYHLVAGSPPHVQDSAYGLMKAHTEEPILWPEHLLAYGDGAFANVVELMMAKDPDERYQKYDSLKYDLQQAVESIVNNVSVNAETVQFSSSAALTQKHHAQSDESYFNNVQGNLDSGEMQTVLEYQPDNKSSFFKYAGFGAVFAIVLFGAFIAYDFINKPKKKVATAINNVRDDIRNSEPVQNLKEVVEPITEESRQVAVLPNQPEKKQVFPSKPEPTPTPLPTPAPKTIKEYQEDLSNSISSYDFNSSQQIVGSLRQMTTNFQDQLPLNDLNMIFENFIYMKISVIEKSKTDLPKRLKSQTIGKRILIEKLTDDYIQYQDIESEQSVNLPWEKWKAEDLYVMFLEWAKVEQELDVWPRAMFAKIYDVSNERTSDIDLIKNNYNQEMQQIHRQTYGALKYLAVNRIVPHLANFLRTYRPGPGPDGGPGGPTGEPPNYQSQGQLNNRQPPPQRGFGQRGTPPQRPGNRQQRPSRN